MVQPPHPCHPEQAQLMIPPWTDCTRIDTVLALIPRVAAGRRRKGGWVGLTALMKKETVGEMEGEMRE